jgi:hypothetical protein
LWGNCQLANLLENIEVSEKKSQADNHLPVSAAGTAPMAVPHQPHLNFPVAIIHHSFLGSYLWLGV